MTTTYTFDPHTVLARVAPDDARTYITHLHDAHDSGRTPYMLIDCPTCYATVLRWHWVGLFTAGDVIPADSTQTAVWAAAWTAITNPDQDQASTAVAANTTYTYTTDRAATRPAGSGDIIDTVDGDGNLLCACGCRTRITDRSPSAYFAIQDYLKKLYH